ncbi:nitroreductase family protein [Acidocella aminolytica]|jgi:nitroreductase|uniref:Nitroreductase domain-containing protein n=1 Tax=Acidocella aminolytica 101 = DSM 11237 TaxID=1120923 RepID=A0A0D6PF61_9PROT|nr:nitroreductase family protein [Acidocella aminolytica]GAN79843.1 hypothetical protein Aam_031_009 [Acidocella aminolytica 101 = DSM 11237]GBQ36591.1 nitroreductase [Acidocella aminolytica 101 = DSM 11237]SHF26076.1 Nitroreductase [Acidocella aminolytica 101 = DSM 11237]
MDLEQAIYGRRAVRTYTSAPVLKGAIEQLIGAAIQAPSAVDTQPWHFTVITDGALLAQIAAAAKSHMAELLSKRSDVEPRLRQHLETPDFQIFYHAPALVVISVLADDWAVENASLAAENFMLAAHAAGLGTCWIGFAQHWLGTPAGRAAIRLSQEFTPVAPIILGHPAEPVPAVPRRPARIDWLG